jgi:hypothetical protein
MLVTLKPSNCLACFSQLRRTGRVEAAMRELVRGKDLGRPVCGADVSHGTGAKIVFDGVKSCWIGLG